MCYFFEGPLWSSCISALPWMTESVPWPLLFPGFRMTQTESYGFICISMQSLNAKEGRAVRVHPTFTPLVSPSKEWRFLALAHLSACFTPEGGRATLWPCRHTQSERVMPHHLLGSPGKPWRVWPWPGFSLVHSGICSQHTRHSISITLLICSFLYFYYAFAFVLFFFIKKIYS